MFLKYFQNHKPTYHLDDGIQQAVVKWQMARQQRMAYLADLSATYHSSTGMALAFTWEREYELRTKEDETENEFWLQVAQFEKDQQAVQLLSKSWIVNFAALISFCLWTILLISSIFPITTKTEAGVRDIVEMALEVGEKLVGLMAATAKTYTLRVVTFCFVAGYAVIKKGLEVHVDPAPARKSDRTWSYIGVLVAKAFEHVIYAVRLAPASRAWEFWARNSKRQTHFLSVEQMARRSIWANEYFRDYQLNQQDSRLMDPGRRLIPITQC